MSMVEYSSEISERQRVLHAFKTGNRAIYTRRCDFANQELAEQQHEAALGNEIFKLLSKIQI
jgi:hypothetical protein